MIRFAFYGRVSTEDQQDPEASRSWQLGRARALIEGHGQVAVEYFDVGQSRSLPWKRRPEAARLLQDLPRSDRGFEAVVIGEPHRAFYGNQYGLTMPVFEHYGVALWVPEVGGPIDPASEAHDLIMSVFGGMSTHRPRPPQIPASGQASPDCGRSSQRSATRKRCGDA